MIRSLAAASPGFGSGRFSYGTGDAGNVFLRGGRKCLASRDYWRRCPFRSPFHAFSSAILRESLGDEGRPGRLRIRGSPAGITCATPPTARPSSPQLPSWPKWQRHGVEGVGGARSSRAEGTQYVRRQARVAQLAGGTPFRAVTVRVRIALRVRGGRGLVAHLGERPSCKRKAAGSIPAGSTGGVASLRVEPPRVPATRR